jgi:hypothetical protein
LERRDHSSAVRAISVVGLWDHFTCPAMVELFTARDDWCRNSARKSPIRAKEPY